MKAIEIKAFGPAKNLKQTDREIPELQDKEVLIKVHAAGVNRPDIAQRLGKYPPPPGASDIPGLEVSGEVIESKSQRWKPGDKLCALLSGGGYAEYAMAPEGQCLPIPNGLSMTEAAVLPEGIFTVWNNLFTYGRLKPGETALVHGGASGIGTMAIQMARALDSHIIVTAGSEKKCMACRELGADLAINYNTQDYVESVKTYTGGKGIEVVMDMVGGDYVGRNLELLALDGRHVSIAYLQGSEAAIDIRQIMTKRLTLTGSTLRPRPRSEKEALATAIKEKVWPHIENGKIKPVIFKTFPLKDAAKAHSLLEEGEHVGKIVLEVL